MAEINQSDYRKYFRAKIFEFCKQNTLIWLDKVQQWANQIKSDFRALKFEFCKQNTWFWLAYEFKAQFSPNFSEISYFELEDFDVNFEFEDFDMEVTYFRA